MTEIKHSILIMTYNQEQLLPFALDSVLNQSVQPYEVIIGDDCSTDHTWQVACAYQTKYPGIVKAFRNEKNLGVFGNFNKLKKMPTGDFVNFVSGDDLLPEGTLEKYDRYIKEHVSDWHTAFIIYTDSLLLKPDGRITLVRNYRNRKKNLIELTFLEAFYIWETGMSIELVKAMPDIRLDLGYQADWLFHIERIQACRNHYFMEAPGYIYRMDVGVTAASKKSDLEESRLKVLNVFKARYVSIISIKTLRYFHFLEALIRYQRFPSVYSYLALCISRLKVGVLPPNALYEWRFGLFIPISLKPVVKKVLSFFR